MSKILKSLMRDELTTLFADVDGGLLISAQGLNSEKTYAFRKAMHQRNVSYTIVKNSLARAAFKARGYKTGELEKVFKGPVGILYTEEEGSATSAARAVSEWKVANKDKIIQYVGALLEGQVLGAKDAEQLKNAPTKDQARAQLLGIIQAPATQLLGTIREPHARVVYLLNALKEKMEGKSGGGGEGEAA